MSFTFIPAGDPRTRFQATIPTPEGNIEFDVPRMDFIPTGVLEDYLTWQNKNTEDKLLKAGKHPVITVFDWFMDHLKIDHWEYFRNELTLGEKTQLWDEWNRVSQLPLGESSASSNS